jgi:ATPase complex subunit ATP10
VGYRDFGTSRATGGFFEAHSRTTLDASPPNTMLLLRRPLRPASIKYDSAVCLVCQWRSFGSSARRLSEKGPATPEPLAPSPPPPPSALDDAPRAYGKAVSEFTPKPLNRPIGLPKPPRPGQNLGVDTRTWRQRRDDFVNYDKHLVRRKEL